MSELKPCPNPECADPTYVEPDKGEGEHWVYCHECFTAGPVGRSATDGVRLWNLLPRKGDVADAWDAGAEQAAEDSQEARHYAPRDSTYAKNPHRKPVTP